MDTIRALVFDLAGVLLDFGGIESLSHLSGGRVGEEEFGRWSLLTEAFAFDLCFFSSEIGLRKPDLDCYSHVVRHLQCMPDEVAFFDDSSECVAGARELGLLAHRCAGIESLHATVRRLEVVGV